MRTRPERTPLSRRLVLETDPEGLTARVLDLVAPLGKGQQALIVGPPRCGATTLVRAVARGLARNHPECRVIVVLTDGDTRDAVGAWEAAAEVVTAGTEHNSTEQIARSTAALLRADRMAKAGGDAVLLLDSLNALLRAFVAEYPPDGRWGRRPEPWDLVKQFLRTARSEQEGGSLTLVATVRDEGDGDGSRFDGEVVSEYGSDGDVRVTLDARLAERGIWPAIDLHRTGTRRAELLRSADEQEAARLLEQVFADLHPTEAMELLTHQLRKAGTNSAFLERVRPV